MKKHPSGELGHYNWHTTYRYSSDGEEKHYNAYFNNPNTPPLNMELYYLDNLKKLFSYAEYHWENHKGIILLLLMALP